MAEQGSFGKGIREAVGRIAHGHVVRLPEAPQASGLNPGQPAPEMLRGVVESKSGTSTSFARDITRVARDLRAGRLGSETVLRTRAALLERKTRLESADNALAMTVRLMPGSTALYQPAAEGQFNYVDPRNARRRVGFVDSVRGFFSNQVDRFPTKLLQISGQMGTIYMGEEIGAEKGQLYLELTEWSDAPTGPFGFRGRASRADYLIPVSAVESTTAKLQARQLPTFKNSMFNL